MRNIISALSDRIASQAVTRDAVKEEDRLNRLRIERDAWLANDAARSNPAPAIPVYSLSREAREARDAITRAHLAATAVPLVRKVSPTAHRPSAYWTHGPAAGI